MTDYYVLHSGGLDSTTALALAAGKNDLRNLYSVGVDYGQRHKKELQAAQVTAAALGARRLTLDLTGYGDSVESALTDPNIAVPEGDYDSDNMAVTVVPGRNAVFLAAIAGIAQSVSKGHPAVIVIGVHGGDHHLYPDCRPEFIEYQSKALQSAYGVTVEAPFLNVDKAEIIRRGVKVGAPLVDTWSCYNDGAFQCGRCGTCRERIESFKQAGVTDQTIYETI